MGHRPVRGQAAIQISPNTGANVTTITNRKRSSGRHFGHNPPMPTCCWSALLLAILTSSVMAQVKPLPKIVLVGDSIRMGYAPLVAKNLDGKAIVVSPAPNG